MPKLTNSFADDGAVIKVGRNLQLISSNPEVPAEVVAALGQLNAQLNAAMLKGLPMAWVAPELLDPETCLRRVKCEDGDQTTPEQGGPNSQEESRDRVLSQPRPPAVEPATDQTTK